MASVYVNSEKAIKDIRKAFSQLSQEEVNKSVARAINSTLGVVRSEMSRRIRERYNIKASTINKMTSIVRSNYKGLTGSIQLSPGTINITEFAPTQIMGSIRLSITGKIGAKRVQKKKFRPSQKDVPQGVSVEVLKGHRKTIDSASLVSGRGGSPKVKAAGKYARGFVFNEEDKMKTLKSVSIRSIVVGSNLNKELRPFIEAKFAINLQREFEKRVAEAAAKAA